MKKIILEIEGKLSEGDILVYRKGSLKPVDIHNLLPELSEALKAIQAQGEELADLRKNIAEIARIIKEK